MLGLGKLYLFRPCRLPKVPIISTMSFAMVGLAATRACKACAY